MLTFCVRLCQWKQMFDRPKHDWMVTPQAQSLRASAVWREIFISCGEHCEPSIYLGNAKLKVNSTLTLGKVNYSLFIEVFLSVCLCNVLNSGIYWAFWGVLVSFSLYVLSWMLEVVVSDGWVISHFDKLCSVVVEHYSPSSVVIEISISHCKSRLASYSCYCLLFPASFPHVLLRC